jgi:hypothetical protein
MIYFTTVQVLELSASTDRMTDEFEDIWKEAVVALSWNLWRD